MADHSPPCGHERLVRHNDEAEAASFHRLTTRLQRVERTFAPAGLSSPWMQTGYSEMAVRAGAASPNPKRANDVKS